MIARAVCQNATILLLLWGLEAPVQAQTADPQAIAAAQALVDEASELMDAGSFDAACPKLEQATKLVPTGVGARLALAECYVGQGKLASAQGQYLQAEALAGVAKDAKRAKEAGAEAARLKPKIATITLVVPNEVRQLEGISLTWDDVSWEPETWGAPIPVDMGKHVLTVKATGYKLWKHEVNVEVNGKAMEQSVPLLEKLPPEPVKPVVAPPMPEARSARTPLLITGFAVTLVGIGVGVGFTAAAISENNTTASIAEKISLNRNVNEVLCPSTWNDPKCGELDTSGAKRDSSAILGTTGFVVGGVAAVGTLIFAVMSSKKSGDSPKSAILVLPSPGGISMTGTF